MNIVKLLVYKHLLSCFHITENIYIGDVYTRQELAATIRGVGDHYGGARGGVVLEARTYDL